MQINLVETHRSKHFKVPADIVSRTKIEHSIYLSEYVGADVFVKREDQQDSFGSGVKIRQISSVLEHVLHTGETPIIMDCVPQSNCGMSTCAYADIFHVPLHMLVKCPPTDDKSGNLGRIKASNAQITWVPQRDLLPDYVARAIEEHRAAGFTPTVVPAGANCDIAVNGPMRLGIEIAEQEAELGENFDCIVLAVASGGTYAGLQISVAEHGRNWNIHAVRTDDYDDTYYQDTYHRKQKFLGLSDQQKQRLPDRLELYEGATLGGYGMFGVEHAQEALRVLDKSGIFFGPTYAFKALLGAKRMVSEGIIPKGARVLLIHTGGMNELEILPDFIAMHGQDTHRAS